MEKIKVENLTFTYPNREMYALNGINITINSGEFVCICGRSGCGKSTLLRHLKPSLAPHGSKDGIIYFDGQDIMELCKRDMTQDIGFVMQNPDSQIVCDKVWHELAFGLESLAYSNTEIRARAAEMAAFFGIQGWYHKAVSELSGGQKQLLNLAAVMVMQPSVLILDEPTSQLDPIAAHDFLDTVSKISKELGTTIILSEHRLEEALPLADRVVVMDCGKIIADGDTRTVGDMLKDADDDMLLAFPTPMRVYYSVQNQHKCPITVKEGREWLEKIPVDRNIEFLEKRDTCTAKTVLSAENLWFRYEKDTPDILKGLSINIYESELYAIVGGNGAGKTTLLSAIMGINTPYRGKIRMANGKKIAALPQNPQSLFVKNTVLLDLWEMLEDSKEERTVKEQKIRQIVRFCRLEALLDSHPYDLSGGEQQRAALAKVLLCDPDILLLDEPTKGLDAHFKQKLAKMLKKLQQSGVTIIMVSHDIEFCAKYADRLGMFFDGEIAAEDKPRVFFAGKSFYTTAANRMARGVLPQAVLDEDIISAIGGKNVENNDSNIDEAENIDVTPHKNDQRTEVKKKSDNVSKGTMIAVLMILLLVPLTIYAGLEYFGDRKYYLTSILVLIETMLPFVLMFEGRKPRSGEVVIIAVLCAIGVAGRVAFAMLPQFKPVLAVVIISGLCFGGETGFLVGAVTAFVSNFYFTQGPWTPWQMFALGMIGFLSGVLFNGSRNGRNKVLLCVFSFFVTVVIYGGIMDSANVIMNQQNLNIEMFLASFAAGLPMNLILALSTALFLWFMLEPMCEKLERIKIKYGFVD